MTSAEFGEMFEGDFADTCTRKFLLMLIGDQETVSSVRSQVMSCKYCKPFNLLKSYTIQCYGSLPYLPSMGYYALFKKTISNMMSIVEADDYNS